MINYYTRAWVEESVRRLRANKEFLAAARKLNGTFVFRVAGSLVAKNGSSIRLANGAQGGNVYFVAESAEIGDNAALLRKFPAMEGRIFSVDVRADGNLIAAAASLDGRGVINLYTSEYDPKIPDMLLKAYEKTSGGYTKEEREAIEKFTTDGVKLVHSVKVPASVYAIRFSPDGQRLLAGTGNGLILGINVESVSINRDEIDASVDLFHSLKEVLQGR